ncbi:ankyrin repeat domain-containing protein [Aeromonas veronii]|uniref:ankyrin repeat domain-containing protein n=1 Tax=Aeromonas veronii TaxID=654 RepID=UPI001F30B4D8|nr:ankyrin repeat domain-containing protein [Aeromonas veronii]MCF5768400.1 ankyrin repeat domain-containing protein [Aeromonas veronii]
MKTVGLTAQDASFNKLLEAIEINDLNRVNQILSGDIDLEYDDNHALKFACKLGHVAIVKVLLEYDANLHQNHNEALLIAVEHRHTAVTAALLSQGADIHDRNGEIWSQANQNPERNDDFYKLIALGEKTLVSIVLLEQLDNALAAHDYTFANELAHALPKKDWCEGILIALCHGNSEIAKHILEFGADLSQHSNDIWSTNASTVAFWEAWHKCDHSLLPLLVMHGASTADALYSYLYESYASLDSTKKDFVSALIVASNYEKETLEYAGRIALEYGFDDIMQECITYLSEFSEVINRLFYDVLCHDAIQFYPIFISLNAVPQVSGYNNEEWWSFFITGCDNRELITYLAIHLNRSYLSEGLEIILDRALENKDWLWAEQLMLLGATPSTLTRFKTMEISCFCDKVKNEI